MKIEAVTVSVNYSDLLVQCVGNNKKLDRWIIVTAEDDEKTISLCKNFDLEYICSKRLYEGGATFAKGRAVNEGLALLDKDEWLLQLDSDVVLPKDFKDIVLQNVNDKVTLYWCKRVTKEEEGYRDITGWDCNGFFHLWHSSIKKIYPEYSNDAGFDDRIFKEFYELYGKMQELPFRCIDVSGCRNKNWEGRGTAIEMKLEQLVQREISSRYINHRKEMYEQLKPMAEKIKGINDRFSKMNDRLQKMHERLTKGKK